MRDEEGEGGEGSGRQPRPNVSLPKSGRLIFGDEFAHVARAHARQLDAARKRRRRRLLEEGEGDDGGTRRILLPGRTMTSWTVTTMTRMRTTEGRKRTHAGEKRLDVSSLSSSSGDSGGRNDSNVIGFSTIVARDCEVYEVCRLFLSTLMLCDRGNIAVHKAGDGDDAVEKVDWGSNPIINSCGVLPRARGGAGGREGGASGGGGGRRQWREREGRAEARSIGNRKNERCGGGGGGDSDGVGNKQQSKNQMLHIY